MSALTESKEVFKNLTSSPSEEELKEAVRKVINIFLTNGQQDVHALLEGKNKSYHAQLEEVHAVAITSDAHWRILAKEHHILNPDGYRVVYMKGMNDKFIPPKWKQGK